jgi:hypothetical protein
LFEAPLLLIFFLIFYNSIRQSDFGFLLRIVERQRRHYLLYIESRSSFVPLATMLLKHLLLAVVSIYDLSKLALAAGNNGNKGNNNNSDNNQLALNPANVQTGSESNGLGSGAEPGQTASATCVLLYR